MIKSERDISQRNSKMSTRLKLSKEISEQLDFLSRKLGLRRNIVCRLAVGRSLAEKESVKNNEHSDSLGFELNRTTITGIHDDLFRALINQHEKNRVNDFEFFSKYIRNHIERGITFLYREYSKKNSPIEFLVGLINLDRKNKTQEGLFSG